MTALSGKSAKHLESMTKDQLKQACGDSEGSRVFSQFAVQKANWEVDKNTLPLLREKQFPFVRIHHRKSSFSVLEYLFFGTLAKELLEFYRHWVVGSL